jgi:CRISPR-associated protein Csm3
VEKDIARLGALCDAMQLLEDDYLGGGGSRGSGRVRLENIRVEVRGGAPLGEREEIATAQNVGALRAQLGEIQKALRSKVGG